MVYPCSRAHTRREGPKYIDSICYLVERFLFLFFCVYAFSTFLFFCLFFCELIMIFYFVYLCFWIIVLMVQRTVRKIKIQNHALWLFTLGLLVLPGAPRESKRLFSITPRAPPRQKNRAEEQGPEVTVCSSPLHCPVRCLRRIGWPCCEKVLSEFMRAMFKKWGIIKLHTQRAINGPLLKEFRCP